MPRFAFHTDGSIHQLHQTGADGQTQPGSAEATGGGAIGLGKGTKQLGLLIGGQSDARVLNLETQFHAIPMGSTQGNRDVNLALFCELDGVASQVGQDLAHAQGIAQQQNRHLGWARDHQLQPLFRGPHADQGGHVVEHVVQTENQVLKFQFGGLDLGQIQNVVDDAEKVLRGGFELGQVVALRGRQAGVLQQVGHANHGVQGRANLVAHCGQEAALGLIAHLGALALGPPNQQHEHAG